MVSYSFTICVISTMNIYTYVQSAPHTRKYTGIGVSIRSVMSGNASGILADAYTVGSGVAGSRPYITAAPRDRWSSERFCLLCAKRFYFPAVGTAIVMLYAALIYVYYLRQWSHSTYFLTVTQQQRYTY
jgi:hypothetical protein